MASKSKFSFKLPFLSLKKLTPQKQKQKAFSFINLIPKRIRIVIATLVMMILLTVSSFFTFTDSWYVFLPIILIVSYVTTYFAVFEGIDRVEWYMLFVVPIMLAIALYLFYSLLPVRWLTRLPFLILFSLGYYAVLLTMNIFNVGVERSLQLYRAAFSINYLTQTFIVFLFALVTLSFRLNFILNAFIIAFLALTISMQLFWSVKLEKSFDKKIVTFSVVLALLLFEVALIASFVPLKINVIALILTAFYYSLAGIAYNYLADRLFKNTLREYAFVMIFVLFITVLTLQW